MAEIGESLRALSTAVSVLLRMELFDMPPLAAFLELLGPLADGATTRSSPSAPANLPVVAHFSTALSLASGEAGGLAQCVAQLRPALTFVQNPNYRAAPPSAGFLDNYGYAVFAGPEDAAPALVASPSLAFGLLLLGPHTEYPTHGHPASEVYLPLGPAEWREGESGWRRRPPGCVIYHAPNVRHATRTGEAPLAALYLWRGDLATHARLV